MTLARRRFLFFCALAVAFTVCVDNLVGKAVDPYLERLLANLFGCPVRIEALQMNIITGRVHVSGFEIRNPPGFSETPHLWAKSLDFSLDFLGLLQHKVLISKVTFQDLFFLIERQQFPDDKWSNIRKWVHHIRDRNDDKPEGPEESPSWIVDIAKIEFHNSTFIFDDRTRADHENRYVFDRLDGSLDGFHWPTDSPTDLHQKVHVKGIMGADGPSTLEIDGDANFATKHVSFDLTGYAKGGKINEYRRFWKEYPIQVQDGKFDLAIRMICMDRQIKTQTMLRLYELSVMPGGKPAELFLGVPYTAALAFLQSQKEIHLKIPVSGDIREPEFEFNRAFGRAFQESLSHKMQSGIRALTVAPVILAEKTGKAVTETVVGTQEKLTGGLEKITSFVVKKEAEPKEGESNGT
ncbi:MAG TPA: DUF748 domain-containing protein [Verrucomicrobiae bacterium]|jgi:hypothetical protein|nr:DUF748 domain-containing protein [Verrucomicrobiae bacterium]